MPSSYAVGEHFEQFIKKQIEGGRYTSASEVVRDALRLLEHEEQQRAVALATLRNQIKAGLASGRGKPAQEVLGRLERKYADMDRVRRAK